MLSVIMLIVIMLSVIMLSFIMLSGIMLSVIMLSVILLSVVAPSSGPYNKTFFVAMDKLMRLSTPAKSKIFGRVPAEVAQW
jgi:hypothetical protein